jgi:hypothetical protein
MKRILLGLALALAVPALVLAQAAAPAPAAGQSLILEYVDGSDLTVTTLDGKVLKLNAGIFEGDAVPGGATLKTGATTTAELRLKPNGSIIKLAKSTTFVAKTLAATAQDKSVFALASGKLRAIAAKGGQYDFQSQTAVCGVRGTDFDFNVDTDANNVETKALLVVAHGNISFDKLGSDGNPLGQAIDVGEGMAADAFAAAFQAVKYSADQLAGEFADMSFKKLNELEVPGHAEEIGATPPSAQTPPAPAPSAPAPAAAQPAPAKPQAESAFLKWLRDAMGMELGSVTINNTTYSKAVIQPNFNFGKVKLGLYLPVIYSSNMFDPNDWYKPNGVNEWSFGGDKFASGDYLGGAVEFAEDLALKIKYFEIGRQFEDPFFIKVGNLEDLTLGHGLIMRNYANDTEFPAIRRVGFNIGVDAKSGGFEAIVNDLSDPEIFGGRLYIRPISGFKLAFGISGVLDTNPTAGLSTALADSYGDPMLLGAGLDMDLPIIQSDLLSIRLFADAAAETEYLRSAAGGQSAGLVTSLVYDSSTGNVRNWGAAGGLMGKLLVIDWRLEYRYYTGIFQPSLFDSTYDKARALIAANYYGYISGTSDTAFDSLPTVMGVYGEGAFSIMRNKLSLTLGYMWPWVPGEGLSTQLMNANDEFHAKLVVLKGLIPVFDVHGSIFYDKHGLVNSIESGSFQFFDANTTFGGELDVPIPNTPNLELAAIFAAAPVLDATTGATSIQPAISLEMRLSF